MRNIRAFLGLLASVSSVAAQVPVYSSHFDGSGSGQELGRPLDIVVEPRGTLLVIDSKFGALRRFTTSGTSLGYLGHTGTAIIDDPLSRL